MGDRDRDCLTARALGVILGCVLVLSFGFGWYYKKDWEKKYNQLKDEKIALEALPPNRPM
jgi:septation ring formation regulator EzrA